MPRLSIWSIRIALVCLALGFTFGALMLSNKGIPYYPAMWRLFPSHIDLLLIGWTAQFAMGVAFWILPRFGKEPKRGNVPLAWAALLLLNLGVLIILASTWLPEPPWLFLSGRLLEGLAAVLFAVYAWPRVKSFGR